MSLVSASLDVQRRATKKKRVGIIERVRSRLAVDIASGCVRARLSLASNGAWHSESLRKLQVVC